MEVLFRDDLQNKETPGVVVISHGKLAKEMVLTAEMIMGPQVNTAALCYEEGDSLDSFRESISETLDRMPEGTVVLVDLYGGTPFNQMMLLKLKDKMDINAIAGMNLPVLLEVLDNRYTAGGKKLLDDVMGIDEIALVEV